MSRHNIVYKSRVTLENVGRLFVSFEPGPILDNMNKLLIKGLKHGVRAFPINFPGTAYRHALQVRN